MMIQFISFFRMWESETWKKILQSFHGLDSNTKMKRE